MNCKSITPYIIALLVCITSSCNLSNKPGPKDYKEGLDLNRLPLLASYEIISADNGSTFTFMLPFGKIKEQYYTDQITPTDSVGLTKDLILLYSHRIDLGPQMTEAWFVIDIKNHNETVFTNHDSLDIFSSRLAINNVKMYSVDSLFASFKRNGSLPAQWQSLNSGN